VCLGDLVEDELEDGWVVCVICARSFPAAEIQADQELAEISVAAAELPGAA